MKNILLNDESQKGTFFAQNFDKLEINRYFTGEGVHPYDEIEWERRVARITSAKGETVFEQKDVETPKFWSQTATDIVAEKYFSGHVGKPGREYSVRQLIDRVADTITTNGKEAGYFSTEKDAKVFNHELKYLLVHQKAAFNSPVWFNVGVEKRPQCSACFILSIADSRESIAEWYKTEMMIFSGGSGAGINLSALRSSKENISNRGKSSGPVSFMKGADAIAGTIKSGGKTRRAAKMVILNIDHPDVRQFIVCKWKEEEKAKALLALGYDSAIDGEVYANTFFQNANNSVRVSDEFMLAVAEDKDWHLRMVRTGEIAETVKAKDLMRLIAEATWNCADPGIQFDSTINRWHTCPNTGRINGSNPCSEYMHLDDSACNLASLNLLGFFDGNVFDMESFRKAVRILIIAQDIIVGFSSYPTEKIAENAKSYRQLGLGYANLGALMMNMGLAYDSDEARAYAGAITSIMNGEAYTVSAELAKSVGSFAGFEKNREPMMNVIRIHGIEAKKISQTFIPQKLWQEAQNVWARAYDAGRNYGIRNSQATVLAPTGTIAFMMDCTTTGIEPAFSLVAYKKMVGGGFLKISNTAVEPALRKLGYAETEIKAIMDYLLANDTIEGAPYLKDEHLAVFDCATNAAKGTRSIHYLGHIRMMGAAQQFISGAISKTVNLPESATIEDIMNTYLEAWKLGLKAIAIYRDNSKGAQPLNTSKTKDVFKENAEMKEAPGEAQRKKMPADVKSLRHKFSIAGHEGYIHCGMYDDGKLGEVFIRVAKEGSTISGLMEAIGVMMSVALQSGVPVETIIRKFVHWRFEPAGFTTNQDIPIAKSILDYIGKYLAINFLSAEDQASMGVYPHGAEGSGDENGDTIKNEAPKLDEQPKIPAPIVKVASFDSKVFALQDAPFCRCGNQMRRTGSCYACSSCGNSIGGCS
ncbi:ribonucleoside-diphosphate reductase, adenosylcobalamin-dependent [Candidatus Giovannonibacteria bacterium RIFCSPHIGHO2_02_43_13]|uniref:Vitamin B12-dependent ribonucleotide reductase n=1 Tax=Candidatus Giovannonibacteria bacterium RIFCSPHIGHO2_02_43_13 TaxID=1798330 RepID=A0A1F5WSW3_9BACT|nr:MAG: ribonucleoside-diphosphate reductase, adenosylcobalamin-dependent [Candidatus Giovannonibacteria bacterium RIFCSPHIGHO2_12_FULL_44_42]OGF78720.1 MAG: ribonucleoside-diphosphate reductase, adenosylcobalamin-dependent [Candidatus Giovannonibacteria bacterium RIFCSPHIGHO2_02_43_13]OGF97590.1 MAG: ribonucleoside-diphosphate reductase, adenosylcobalamin-dependent [Candidatus Giovannonibacteria bacterium RIFCSPLOWO2_12_FULL_44_32]